MKTIRFPQGLLKPVKSFLSKEEKRLRKKKKELKKEDPFEDTRRVDDNASVDTEAAEQFGHEKTEAIVANPEPGLAKNPGILS